MPGFVWGLAVTFQEIQVESRKISKVLGDPFTIPCTCCLSAAAGDLDQHNGTGQALQCPEVGQAVSLPIACKGARQEKQKRGAGVPGRVKGFQRKGRECGL